MFDTRPTVWYNTHMTNRNDFLFTALFLATLYIFSVSISFCMGYLFGAGFAYLGWLENPLMVALIFAITSTFSFFMILLNARKQR